MLVVGVVLAIFVEVPRLIKRTRNYGRRQADIGFLRLQGSALRQYHDEWGSFPPHHYVDEAGKPMHSWRVLILPYLELDSVYSTYQFSEPWDSPRNHEILNCPIKLFKSWSDYSTDWPGPTNYVAVTGAGTMWPDNGSAKLTDIEDDPAGTLVIVEISNSTIHWMEPRDLPIGELEAWLDPKHQPRLFGNRIEGGLVCMADGSVKMLPRDVTIERLREMARIADGK